MISSIWKPLYVEDFDYEQYLYHYTSVEAAIKIISNNSLLFSRISNTNDTSESKMKIIFSQDNIVNKEDYRKKLTQLLIILINIIMLCSYYALVRMQK